MPAAELVHKKMPLLRGNSGKLLRQSWAVVEWYVEWYAPPAGFNSGASLILSEYKKPVSIQHSLAIYTGERGGGAHKE